MNRLMVVSVAALLVLSFGLTGCKPSDKQMAEMMKPPARPEAIDHMQMFIGSWDSEAQIKIAAHRSVLLPVGGEQVGAGGALRV